MRRAAMVGLVDDLEAQGLLERRRHPTDRRANALHLTAGRPAAGHQDLRCCSAGLLEDELLGPLPPDERERFLEGLRRRRQRSAWPTASFPTAADDQHDAERPDCRTTRVTP